MTEYNNASYHHPNRSPRLFAAGVEGTNLLITVMIKHNNYYIVNCCNITLVLFSWNRSFGWRRRCSVRVSFRYVHVFYL